MAGLRLGFFDVFSFNKKLLKERVGTDMIIFSEGGFAHHCHKAFLIVHSPVFEAMFQNEWNEATENTIRMTDISKDAVDGVLAYLYYCDLETPYKDLNLAREILLFANKYSIQHLETAVVKLILRQPEKWFSIEATFCLYLTVKGCELPFREELERKTLQIMKKKYAELSFLPDFKSLITEDPETFLELSNDLIHLDRWYSTYHKPQPQRSQKIFSLFSSSCSKLIQGLRYCQNNFCRYWGPVSNWVFENGTLIRYSIIAFLIYRICLP